MKDEEDKRIQFSLCKKFIEQLSNEFNNFEQLEIISLMLAYTVAKNFQVDTQEEVLEIVFSDIKKIVEKTRDRFKKEGNDVD